MIQNEAQVLLQLGDNDYVDSPLVWFDYMEEYLPADFPTFVVIGNHDKTAWYGDNNYQQRYYQRLQKQGLDKQCMGEVGLAQVCSYKGITMFLSGCNVIGKAKDGHSFMEVAMKNLGSIWNIGAWHENNLDMTIGSYERLYPDSVGWKQYEIPKTYGALIFTAHDHAYARTYPMSNIEKKTYFIF